MQRKKVVMAILLAAGLMAGCKSDVANSGSEAKPAVDAQETSSEEDTEDNDSKEDIEDNDSKEDTEDKDSKESAADHGSEEKTEVRREKYDDCDGSGHGYVEIYYSDGSMETEEY